MNDKAILQRLIWKDIETIKPLVLVAAIGIVAFNLLIFSLWRTTDFSNAAFVDWTVILWFMLPLLVAFGAPALLVGTEQESGTLGWLRTLPVRWQHVAGAKFWVAAGAVAATWAAASLVLWLASFGWQLNPYSSTKPHDLVGFRGVLLVGFYNVLLVLLGFALTYLVRSPLLALSLEVPLLIFLIVVAANVIDAVNWMDSETIPAAGIYAGLAILLPLWWIQRILARRRMVSPDENVMTRGMSGGVASSLLKKGSDPLRPSFFAVNQQGLQRVRPLFQQASRYRPTTLPVYSRPSQAVSLLWQQLRQTGPLCLTLVVLSGALTIVLSVATASDIRPMTMLRITGLLCAIIVPLSGSWLGAVVFYGDNVHRRRGFFADRGISPTRVWWTRMLPPAVSCLLLLLLCLFVVIGFGLEAWTRTWGSPWNLIASILVLFAFGQLVSQWIERPMLAFFAAPAYAWISLLPVIYLIERYDHHADVAAIVLAVPVLLLGSWQLTGRWLEGRIDSGYTVRVLGYTAAAVLLPCMWILGCEQFVRLLSLPAFAGVTP